MARSKGKKAKRERLKAAALKKQQGEQSQAQTLRQNAIKDNSRSKAQEAKKQEYYNAVKRYKQLEKTIHEQHDKISSSLTNLENRQNELNQTEEARQRILTNIDKAQYGLQNEVALLIHAKYPANHVNTLKQIIDQYNNEKQF